MKLNILFIITGILGLFFGLLLVAVPGPFYAFYGGELADFGKNAAQLQGAAYLGYCLLLFFVVKAKDLKARQAVVIGLLVHFIIGFVVSLKWQLAGVGNAWGWSTVAIFGLLSLGYLYFLIRGTE
ncbi:MAG: hypothetical protein OEY18_12770 [Candidatus Aminicenantes bacterium]|nr:hypothetical protein [Candidatus Aminicenantes bacterium]MDH5385573.1 hypothetical protein [Candidatus Aminicenantes bacterium]MDH5744845.1 hypothetical protein [Candidatus Aminicenantes bacterium]